MKQPIFLVGYRCVGKTTVAGILEERLGVSSVDVDDKVVAHAGMPVADIVAREGWDGFRRREEAALFSVIEEGFGVIATGGGIVTRKENVAHMRANGTIIRLSAAPAVVMERMGNDTKSGALRPSLTGADPLLEVQSVMAKREALYACAADLEIKTDRLSPRAVAGVIVWAMARKGEF